MRFLTLALALLIAAPAVVVALAWLAPPGDVWTHFAETLLAGLIGNTLILLVGVGAGVAVLGTTLAWLVVMVEFPGRRYLEWALLLPFAIPAYVLGFVYLGIFDEAGAVQGFLRTNFDFGAVDIREGYLPMIAIFSLVFYPYVYLICRAAFKQQRSDVLASARLLGAKPGRVFRALSIPLAIPSIGAGVLVAMMETLADFGMVSLFNYDTLTTAVYSAWGDFRAVDAAAQLASVLVVIATVLLYLEYRGRRNIQYHGVETDHRAPYQLKNYQGYLVGAFISLIVFLSFVLPVFQLIFWIIKSPEALLDFHRHRAPLTSSLILALLAILMIITIANVLAFQTHKNPHRRQNIIARLATLGYAVPGVVLAVGLLYGVKKISGLSEYLFAFSLTEYLFGSVALLLFAYVSRFMAIGYQSIYAAYLQIKPSLTDSARLLGAKRGRLALGVEMPLIKPGIIAATILVFIDVIKELPATYLLRPFGWDTLAVKVYEYSADARYGEAAVPALLMVLLAAIFVLIFQRLDKKRTDKN